MLIEIIGWIGSLMFALSPVPQAWKSWKEKHSRGVSLGTLWFWQIGEVLTLTYVAAQSTLLWPLLVQYLSNIFFISVILFFKYKPKDNGPIV